MFLCCVHWRYLCVCVFLSDEELDNRNGREQFVELDSLDTEKALLLTDDDDPLWVCDQLTLELASQIQKMILWISHFHFPPLKYVLLITLHCILTLKLQNWPWSKFRSSIKDAVALICI